MMAPAGLYAALSLLLIGLALGSFANVAIWRVPLGLSVVRPPSACPTCHARLTALDMVPVLSWVLLRGHCRHCHTAISAQYPLVEGLMGLLGFGLGWRWGLSWTALVLGLLLTGMVVLGIIDLRHMRLPRQIVYWTSALVLAAILAGSADTGACQRLGTCALCALAAWAVFGAVWYFYPKGMGGGDVRLAGLVGLGLGWLGAKDVVLGFILAAFVAAFAGSLLIALGRAGRRTPIPFGTCIAVATCAVAYAGPTIVTWYTGLLH